MSSSYTADEADEMWTELLSLIGYAVLIHLGLTILAYFDQREGVIKGNLHPNVTITVDVLNGLVMVGTVIMFAERFQVSGFQTSQLYFHYVATIDWVIHYIYTYHVRGSYGTSFEAVQAVEFMSTFRSFILTLTLVCHFHSLFTGLWYTPVWLCTFELYNLAHSIFVHFQQEGHLTKLTSSALSYTFFILSFIMFSACCVSSLEVIGEPAFLRDGESDSGDWTVFHAFYFLTVTMSTVGKISLFYRSCFYRNEIHLFLLPIILCK